MKARLAIAQPTQRTHASGRGSPEGPRSPWSAGDMSALAAEVTWWLVSGRSGSGRQPGFTPVIPTL